MRRKMSEKDVGSDAYRSIHRRADKIVRFYPVTVRTSFYRYLERLLNGTRMDPSPPYTSFVAAATALL